MAIITRVGWCLDCFKAERPRTDNFFVARGTNGWHVMKANHIGNLGYTPHLYRSIKIIGENVVYEKMCAMHSCGTDIYYDSLSQNYKFVLGKWERGMMTLSDWNSLQHYKHDPQFEI